MFTVAVILSSMGERIRKERTVQKYRFLFGHIGIIIQRNLFKDLIPIPIQNP